jgi:hypothetical protein
MLVLNSSGNNVGVPVRAFLIVKSDSNVWLDSQVGV